MGSSSFRTSSASSTQMGTTWCRVRSSLRHVSTSAKAGSADSLCLYAELGNQYSIPQALPLLQVYESLFDDGTPERIEQLFHRLDRHNTGFVDYLEWSKQVQLMSIST